MREVSLAIKSKKIVAVALRRKLCLELLGENLYLLTLMLLVLVLELVHI